MICAELAKLGGRPQARVHDGDSCDRLRGAGQNSRRSCKDEGPTPQLDASDLPEGARMIFFSQRWLTVSHPDDDKGTKRAAIVAAAEAYAKQAGIELEQGIYLV